MNEEAQMLGYYESVVSASEDMLHAARRNDWDALVVAEKECARRIEVLKAANLPAQLSKEVDQRRFELIRTVLSHDAEIRALTQPWMTQLEQMLGAAHMGRRIDQTYR